MSEIDYEELIRSPLDGLDEESSGAWLAVGGGALIGAAVALALSLVLSGDGDIVVGEDAASTTTTTIGVVVETPTADYPPGYVEFAPGIAANSGEIIIDDDLVVVAFTTAAIRGSDPVANEWPRGGSWLLETDSGTAVESSRVVVGRFSPAAFTVHFPARQFNGATDFAAATLIERWDPVEFTGSVTIPFAGEPFESSEPITLPVTQDVTLLIPNIKLGRFLGSVDWATTGGEATVEISVTLLDDAGDPVGAYERFPEIRDATTSGRNEILWQEPFPTDQEGAVTAVVDYRLTIAEVVPVSVTFDLTGVPLGR